MQYWLLARALVCGLLVLSSGCRFHLAPGDETPLADASVDEGAPSDDAGGIADLAGPTDDLAPLNDLATSPDMAVVPTPTLVGMKAAGPTTSNLSSEGTTDWIHLGLTAANDVNRKSGGGSRITVTANGTLAQYTSYATSFSWTAGTPTATVTNTPNGVYVLGTGKGFTVTAPADTTERTLRLYLNVGGTAALKAHLSDSSAADYNDTQTSANNGSTWLYTIRYAAASASQTVSITWQLSSGTGASFIAATLQ